MPIICSSVHHHVRTDSIVENRTWSTKTVSGNRPVSVCECVLLLILFKWLNYTQTWCTATAVIISQQRPSSSRIWWHAMFGWRLSTWLAASTCLHLLVFNWAAHASYHWPCFSLILLMFYCIKLTITHVRAIWLCFSRFKKTVIIKDPAGRRCLVAWLKPMSAYHLP